MKSLEMGGKGKGQRGRPYLTSWGKHGNKRREKRVGYGGSAQKGKVKTMKEEIDMRRRKLGVLCNSDPP